MAERNSAPIVLRAQRACLAAAAVGALLTAGCNHRRSVLRPVLPAPRAVAAPGCTNCGSGGSTVVTEPGAPVLRGGPSAVSDEPVINSPGVGGLDSSVPLEAPTSTSSSSSSSRRVPSAETPPKATIGEPPLDDLSPASTTRSGVSRSRSLRPPVDSKPKAAPELSAPASGTSPTSMKPDSSGGLRTSSTGGVVRRASASDPLKAYFAGEEAEDLYFPNKADRPWKYAVVHHSATETGSYTDIDAEHRKLLGLDGCGYHFVIGNGTGSGDGQIEVSHRWVNQKHGVHCRNARRADMDEYGIGICLIGDFEKNPPTPRQTAALKALLGYLSEHYKIEQDRVETHAHMAATPTVCPGKHFPMDALTLTTRPAANQAAAANRAPRAVETTRRVPTAWNLKEGELEVPALSPPVR